LFYGGGVTLKNEPSSWLMKYMVTKLEVLIFIQPMETTEVMDLMNKFGYGYAFTRKRPPLFGESKAGGTTLVRQKRIDISKKVSYGACDKLALRQLKTTATSPSLS